MLFPDFVLKVIVRVEQVSAYFDAVLDLAELERLIARHFASQLVPRIQIHLASAEQGLVLFDVEPPIEGLPHLEGIFSQDLIIKTTYILLLQLKQLVHLGWPRHGLIVRD